MNEALAIIRSSGYGDVATSIGDQPRVRPMAFVISEEGTLWSSTHKTSGKVQEFQTNDQVEVCFTDDRKYHVRIEGRVSLSGGAEKKRKLLEMNPRVKNHFLDEEDPKFVHVEIIPVRIRWTEPGYGEYHDVADLRSEL